jgi:hypothetical protein
MQLITLKPNSHLIKFNPSVEVLFSYETLVGLLTCHKCYVLAKGESKRSATTSKQINAWTKSHGLDVIEVSESDLSAVGGPFLPPPPGL